MSQCVKTGYATEQTVKNVIKQKAYDPRSVAYHCRACSAWHVKRPNKTKQIGMK